MTKSIARLYVNDTYIETFEGTGKDASSLAIRKLWQALDVARAVMQTTGVKTASIQTTQDTISHYYTWNNSEAFFGKLTEITK